MHTTEVFLKWLLNDRIYNLFDYVYLRTICILTSQFDVLRYDMLNLANILKKSNIFISGQFLSMKCLLS